MKLLLVIFIIYINYSLSQNLEEDKRVFVKSFPKKVLPGLFQINDAGKYYKTTLKKITVPDNSYTVFSKVFPNENTGSHLQEVPDSPYFPVETPLPGQGQGLKRVKKFVTEYEHILRHKRSADDENEDTKKTELQPAVVNDDRKKKTKTQPTLASGKTDRHVKKFKSATKKHKDHESDKKKQELAGNENKNKQVGPSKTHKHHEHQKKSKRTNKKHRHAIGKAAKNEGDIKAKKPKKPSDTVKKPAQIEAQRTRLRSRSKKSRKVNARRLIAGRDAMIEEYPYVISIQKSGQHWCAGALLNPRLIITTANCMWRSKQVSLMRVRVGSRHIDRGGQQAKIQEVVKHPNWKIRMNPDNDVALALLDRNIKFSHSVHGVDLPNRVMLPAFDDAWITSWGSERRDGVYDPHDISLQVYHARLLENNKCNNVTQRFGVSVSENFFCLAQTGRRAPCTRDTGAPAVSDGVLWGLASWGIRKLCGTERFPAVFSYLASHTNMDFIANATHYLMADERYYPFPDKFPRQKVMITDAPEPTLPF